MLIDKKILVTNVCHFVGASVADVLKSYGGIVTCHDKSFENYNSRENFLSVNPGMRISTTADISDSIADIASVSCFMSLFAILFIKFSYTAFSLSAFKTDFCNGTGFAVGVG